MLNPVRRWSLRVKQVYAHYEHEGQGPDRFRYCPFCATALGMAESGQKLRPACPACGFVQFQNPAPTVSILVVDGERVLLGQRGEEPGQGTWALPSGYIEYEDDFLTTAIHEVKEETGLDVELDSILQVISSFVSPRFHFLSLFLVARVVGGELQAADDLEAVEWFPLAGPLPEMGFQEDLDVIDLYARGMAGLPVEGQHALEHRPGS